MRRRQFLAYYNEIAEIPAKGVIIEALREFEDDDILTREEAQDIILSRRKDYSIGAVIGFGKQIELIPQKRN